MNDHVSRRRQGVCLSYRTFKVQKRVLSELLDLRVVQFRVNKSFQLLRIRDHGVDTGTVVVLSIRRRRERVDASEVVHTAASCYRKPVRQLRQACLGRFHHDLRLGRVTNDVDLELSVFERIGLAIQAGEFGEPLIKVGKVVLVVRPRLHPAQ